MNERILVVDDDDASLHAMVRVLTAAGYSVETAPSGAEALGQAQSCEPDLVLLDVVLPDADGRELCRRIKSAAGPAKPIVLLLSGLRDAPENQIEGLEAGADGYLTRPVSNQHLLAHVRALLRLKRTERELRESERLWRSVLESAGHGIVLLTKELELLVVNPTALSMMGYPPELQQDVRLRDMFDPAHAERIVAMIRNGMPDRGISAEVRGRRRDGSEFPAEVSVSPLGGAGHYAYAMILRDLSQRLAVENLLLQERAEHRERVSGEVASIARSFGASAIPVASAIYGLEPLARRSSEYQSLLDSYRSIVEGAIEQRAYGESHADIAERLQTLSRRLGFLRAGPRDIVDIHSRTMRPAMEGAPLAKQQVWLEEGRLTLLELMGHLTMYYRQMAISVRNPG